MLNKINKLLNSNTLKKFTIYGVGQAFNLVSPILIIPYLVTVCGEKGLGNIGVGMSLAYILIVLVDYSSYIKGVRDVSINRLDFEKLKEIITTIYLSKFILLVIVVFFVFLACFFVPYFKDYSRLYLFSLFIVFGQFLNPTWFLQGMEDFKQISILNVISKIIYLVGVFIFVLDSKDYVYVNFWLGLGALIPSLFMVLTIFKTYKIKADDFKLAKSFLLIKKDFSFCVSQFLFSLRQYSPIIIVNFFGGSFMAGQYKIIEQIIMLFRTYFQIIFRFTFSVICFEIQESFKRGIKTWKTINTYNIAFVLFVLSIVFFFSEEVLLFFNIETRLLGAYQSLLITSLGLPLLIGISLAQEQLIFSFNLNKKYEIVTGMITVLSLTSLYIGVFIGGLFGAIMAQIMVEVLLIIIYYYLLKIHTIADN